MRVPGNVSFKAENRATPAPSDRWLEDSADLHPRLTGGAHFQPPISRGDMVPCPENPDRDSVTTLSYPISHFFICLTCVKTCLVL